MTSITITSPPNSRVDPDGIREYTWMHEPYMSVTSAFKRAGLSHRVHTWAISQVVARAVGEADTLNAMLTRERKPRERVLESNRVAEASRWLRAAATEERDRKAAIGSTVHDAIAEGWAPSGIAAAIETLKDGKPIVVDGHEVRSRLEQFLDWMRVSGARILAQEFQVFNLTAGYGGSGDLIVEFPSGRRFLLDTKTGNSVFSEHVLQVVGYRGAEFSGRDDVVDDYVTGLLAHPLELGILHLAPDHWEFLALKDDPGAWGAFTGALTYARWLNRYPEVEPLVAARRHSHDEPAIAARVARMAEQLRGAAA